MNTVVKQEINSTSLDDTLAVASQIGQRLRGGEVIELVSDLGGGKTTFVRGLAAGMGSQDRVSSPSFTISNQYKSDKLTLYHFDFYRLQELGIIKQELAEILDDRQAVIVIEWAGLVSDILPVHRLSINITVEGEETRRLTLEYSEDLNYLFPGDT